MGARLRRLEPNVDARGSFTELWRRAWGLSGEMPQWNAVRSNKGVLRGVHVHLRHDDYLTVPMGLAVIGLCDLRTESPTHRAVTMVELGEHEPAALSIPHGVAHGFLFLEPSLHCYAVSRYFDPADELGCRFDDPDLAIPWPTRDVVLSRRDDQLPALPVLLDQLERGSSALATPACS